MNIQLNGGENNMNGGDLGSRKGLSPSFENIISIFFPSLESSISIDLSKEFSTIIILILFEISLIKLVNFFLLLCETMTIVILSAKFIIF